MHRMVWDSYMVRWQCRNKHCQLIRYPKMVNEEEKREVPGDYWIS